MEVPSPWLKSPPHLFSRKLITAKPIIFAQQPATAAPPASPVSPNAAHIAAELIGRVSAIPTTTETIIPITSGWSFVAHIIRFPIELAAIPIYFAQSTERSAPVIIVTRGVTMMSTFVFLDTSRPASAAIIAITRTASGPPAPPVIFAAEPTAASENITSIGTPSASPIATAIAAPTTCASQAKEPASTKNWNTAFWFRRRSC